MIRNLHQIRKKRVKHEENGYGGREEKERQVWFLMKVRRSRDRPPAIAGVSSSAEASN